MRPLRSDSSESMNNPLTTATQQQHRSNPPQQDATNASTNMMSSNSGDKNDKYNNDSDGYDNHNDDEDDDYDDEVQFGLTPLITSQQSPAPLKTQLVTTQYVTHLSDLSIVTNILPVSTQTTLGMPASRSVSVEIKLPNTCDDTRLTICRSSPEISAIPASVSADIQHLSEYASTSITANAIRGDIFDTDTPHLSHTCDDTNGMDVTGLYTPVVATTATEIYGRAQVVRAGACARTSDGSQSSTATINPMHESQTDVIATHHYDDKNTEQTPPTTTANVSTASGILDVASEVDSQNLRLDPGFDLDSSSINRLGQPRLIQLVPMPDYDNDNSCQSRLQSDSSCLGINDQFTHSPASSSNSIQLSNKLVAKSKESINQSIQSLHEATIIDQVTLPKRVSQVLQKAHGVSTVDISFDESDVAHEADSDRQSTFRQIFPNDASDPESSESEDGKDYQQLYSGMYEEFEFVNESKNIVQDATVTINDPKIVVRGLSMPVLVTEDISKSHTDCPVIDHDIPGAIEDNSIPPTDMPTNISDTIPYASSCVAVDTTMNTIDQNTNNDGHFDQTDEKKSNTLDMDLGAADQYLNLQETKSAIVKDSSEEKGMATECIVPNDTLLQTSSNTETETIQQCNPAATSTPIAGMIFVVVTAFHGEDLDELEIDVGDQIELDMTPASPEEYWWKGTNRSWGRRNGQQGFFPKNFVRAYDPNAVEGMDEGMSSSAAPISVGEAMSLNSPDHQLLNSDTSAVWDTGIDDQAFLDPVLPGTKVYAKYAYDPEKSDELELLEGELVVVLEAPPGGWWKGMKGLDEKAPKTDPHRKGVSWLRRLVPKDKEKRKRSISADGSTSSTTSISGSSAAANAVAIVASSATATGSVSATDLPEKNVGVLGIFCVDPIPNADPVAASILTCASLQPSDAQVLVRSSTADISSVSETLSNTVKIAQNAKSASTKTVTTIDGPPAVSAEASILTESASTHTLPLLYEPTLSMSRHIEQEPNGPGAHPPCLKNTHISTPVSLVKNNSFSMTSPTILNDLDSSINSPVSESIVSTRTKRSNTIDTTTPQIYRTMTSDDNSGVNTPSNAASPVVSTYRPRASTLGKPNNAARNTLLMSPLLSTAGTSIWNPADLLRGSTPEKWQDRFDESSLSAMSLDDKKRISATWELLQTERDYVRDLAVIVEVFLKPMVNIKSQGKPIINIFANLEQMLSVNADFLNQIELVSDITNARAFSDAFISTGERFLCYIPYIANQNAQLHKFQASMRSKPELSSFIEEANKNPLMRQIDIYGFLLKPIQRICKYPLLLKEIIKHTDKSSSDYSELERAHDRMQRVVSTVNESSRRMVSGMRSILEVQGRFAEKINIANPNRFLVREDIFYVVFLGGSRKSRKLFLFNDIVILARKDWRDKNHVIEKTPLKDIRVSEIIENDVTQDSGVTSLLEIEILPTSEYDPPNRYVLAAATINEKVSWLEAYKSLAKHVIKSKQISDVAMTSSSRDGGDDEDSGEKTSGYVSGVPQGTLSRRDTEEEDVGSPASKSTLSKIADLLCRIKELEQQELVSQKTRLELTTSSDEKDLRIAALESKVTDLSADFSLAQENITRLDEVITQKDDAIKTLQKLANDHEGAVEKYEKTIASLNTTQLEKDAVISGHEESISTLNTSVLERDTIISKNSESISELQATIVDKDLAIKNQDDTISRLHIAEEEMIKLVKDHTETVSSLKTSILEKDFCIKEHLETITQLKSEICKQKDQIETKDTKMEQQEMALVSLTDKHTEICQQKLQLEKELQASISKCINHESSIAQLNAEISQRDTNLKNQEDAITKLTLTLSNTQKTLDVRISELATTTENFQKANTEIKSLEHNIHLVSDQQTHSAKMLSDTQQLLTMSKVEHVETQRQLSELRDLAKKKESEIQVYNDKLLGEKQSLKTRDALLVETQKRISEHEVKISELQTALAHEKTAVAARDSSIRDLERLLAHSNATSRDMDVKLDATERLLKEQRSRLAETETSLQSHQQRLVQRDLLIADQESTIKETKSKLNDFQAECTIIHNKLSQRENTLQDLSKDQRDYKSRMSDIEASYMALQQKCQTKEVKLAEVDAGLTGLQSVHALLKQKCFETEQNLVASQSKLSELQAKLKKTDSSLSATGAARSILENKVSDYKTQVSTMHETISKLERERKDLIAESEAQVHELASLTKELRQVREAFKDAKTDHEKLDGQRMSALREITRELAATEEKWKGMLDKEKRDHASEYAALTAEFQGYRVSSTAELGRIKSESDIALKQAAKDNEDRIQRVREQSDARIEQAHIVMDHERESALAKLNEEKTARIQRISQALETAKAVSHQANEAHKRMLVEYQDKIKERDQSLASKDETIKARDIEITRLNIELKQNTADLHTNESSLEALKLHNRHKLDEFETMLQEKSLMLLRKENEIEDLSHRVADTNERADSLEKLLQKTQREYDEHQRISDDSIEKMHEQETSLRSEVILLQQRIQQFNLLSQDMQAQLDASKAAHGAAVEVSRKELQDNTQLKETLVAHKQLISHLSQEQDSLQIHIRELADTLDRKVQECAILIANDIVSKEALHKKTISVHELEMHIEKTELKLMELERASKTHEKTIYDARDTLKTHQQEFKERQKQFDIDATKRHKSELELQRVRLQEDAEFRIQKLQDRHEELAARMLREGENATKLAISEKEKLLHQIDELSKDGKAEKESKQELQRQFESRIEELDTRTKILMGELEEKEGNVIQLKNHIMQAEIEINTWRDQYQQVLKIKKEMTQQFNNLMAKSVVMDDELIKSRQCNENFRILSETHNTLSADHALAIETQHELQSSLDKALPMIQTLEAAVAKGDKRNLQSIKQLASVQMTINEIAKVVNIPPFESTSDFLGSVDKSTKDGRKRVISVRIMDNSYLISIVSAVSSLSKTVHDLTEAAKLEKIKMCEYQDLQRLAEQELSAASGALQAIEDRIKSRDEHASRDREISTHKFDVLQRTLDAAQQEKKQMEANARAYSLRITALEHDKVELERTFVQLYERLKSGKETQALDVLHLAQQMAALQAEKSKVDNQLTEMSRKCMLADDKIRNLDIERSRHHEMFITAQAQREKAEQLLNESNETSKSLVFELERCRDQVSHVRDEVLHIRKEKTELNAHINTVTKKLNAEIAHSKEETMRLVGECNVLQESVKESERKMHTFEEKLAQAEKREGDIRDWSSVLSEDLKREKVRALTLEQKYDQMKDHTKSIESKLKALSTRSSNHAGSFSAGGTSSSQPPQPIIQKHHIQDSSMSLQQNSNTNKSYPPQKTARKKLPVPTLHDQEVCHSTPRRQPLPLPTLQPLVDDELHVGKLLSMVQELIAYEPEIERQQGMFKGLEKLKMALGQQKPSTSVYKPRGY
ncbi:hypothetical protein BASA61_007134 [Batrachochytrium salamandrivorans]|nr:hypothetical protein BASA61_007134 [Batrachochytrium salamandrivorans]